MVNHGVRRKIHQKERAHLYMPRTIDAQMPYYTPSGHVPSEFLMQQQQQPPQQPQQEQTQMSSSFGSKLSKLFSKSDLKKDADAGEQKDERKFSSASFYFFDHGESEFLRTTDNAPHLVMDDAAERVSNVATKFWAEFFGSINVGVTFFIAFFLQLYR
jgi:hypothetical protein